MLKFPCSVSFICAFLLGYSAETEGCQVVYFSKAVLKYTSSGGELQGY